MSEDDVFVLHATSQALARDVHDARREVKPVVRCLLGFFVFSKPASVVDRSQRSTRLTSDEVAQHGGDETKTQ